MSHRVTSAQLFTGSHSVSLWGGLGITGAEIPTTGDSGGSPLADDSPIAGSEYRLVVTTPPSAGALVLYPDTSFEFSGAPDGSYSFTYQAWEDGVSYGSATDTLVVGMVNASALGGTGTSTGSGSGGSATGIKNATTSGGTGTSTGSGSGGAASGGTAGSGNATGGTGTSVGSGSGGAAIGSTAGLAPGGTGISTGSGSGGTATGSTANATAGGGIGRSTGSGHGGTAYGSGDAIPPGSSIYQIGNTKRNYKVKKMTSLPAKDPEERKIITFDFSVDANEITSAAITASVTQGLKDINPQAIIDGANTISAALVRQYIAGGQSGSTYDLRCVAVDADGEIHVAVGRLPVLRAAP